MDREKYAMPTLVKRKEEDFPSSSMVKNLLGNAEDTGSISPQPLSPHSTAHALQ